MAITETQTNVPCELILPTDSAAELLDVVFVDPAGQSRTVPAFRSADGAWRVRYASPLAGRHAWRGPEGAAGEVVITPYEGDNPLFRHGPVRVAADHRHLEHLDGQPFFWLGDTWWMGLCHRLEWPAEFAALAADRVAKGFNVIQIVAGLYPDMHPFDPRGANEAGQPWELEWHAPRPEYFDAADRRLAYLVEQGLMPCLVGAWGYFLPWLGPERMKRHWRELLARYAAWPLVWCVAGEANLPWYLAPGFPYDDRQQAAGWTEIMRFVRDADPFGRPRTIHPTAINRYTSRHACVDESLLDFDLLQTPHGRAEAAAPTARAARESYFAEPTLPVINGEAAYEWLGDSLPTEWSRAMFWLSVTNGTKGHTYGANGIWQCNRRGRPHGASPHGSGDGYGVIPWDEAMHLPGSTHMGLAKAFLETLPWTELAPLPDCAEWVGATDSPVPPQVCGAGDGLRLIYALADASLTVSGLPAGTTYDLEWFDPTTGGRRAAGTATADDAGRVECAASGLGHDGVLTGRKGVKNGS